MNDLIFQFLLKLLEERLNKDYTLIMRQEVNVEYEKLRFHLKYRYL